jgi:hypothetical protein
MFSNFNLRKRFGDWEFCHRQRSNHLLINGIIVTQKVRVYRRLDKRLNVWESQTVTEPVNQIYYTGKVDKTTSLEDIFTIYYKQ